MSTDIYNHWYAISAEEVLVNLHTCGEGLTSEEAKSRIGQYGLNAIEKGQSISRWVILLHQIKNPLVYILLAAMAISMVIQHWSDAIVIAFVVVLNSAIGFFEEYKADTAMQALINLTAPRAMVRRDGREIQIESNQLVPGDIVLLEAGAVIPADLRILRSRGLQVDESMLTGESLPELKTADRIADEKVTLADQHNMAFMGTSATSGAGTGVVVATGHETQIGTIAGDIRDTEAIETPLENRIRRLSKLLAFVVLVVSAFILIVGLAKGNPLNEMLLTAISIAVSAIPEGLPAVMSIALAIGVRRMAKRHAVIRRLPAVETLGSCTLILTDKTGTLTQNQMTVQKIWADGTMFDVTGNGLQLDGQVRKDEHKIDVDEESPLYMTLLAGVLATEASMDIEGDTVVAKGDPTEVALLVSAAKAGVNENDLLRSYPRIDQIPFDHIHRFSATIHRRNGAEITFVKGPPERVLQMCDGLMNFNGKQDLDGDRIIGEAQAMAKEGLRVLAMAVGEGPNVARTTRSEDPLGLTFVGLQGMMDPPRPEVIDAVAACHQAGIRVIMVTGDHPVTASVIAQKVGLSLDKRVETCSGPEIEAMSDTELGQTLDRVSICARVSPSQKLRIVNTLRKRGEIIAATGDGVNDAPALKSAHLGIAMGCSGTDVAKEASDMVLTDDNFATIYSAVEEGRTSFANIRKATFYLVSCGSGELAAVAGSLFLGMPLPLWPAQILWLNVVTNGVVDIALAFEPGEEEEYQKPPRDPKEGILSRLILERVVVVGLVLAAGTLGIFGWERAGDSDLDYARVAALTTLVVFQVFHATNCRSETQSVFRMNPFTNWILFVGLIGSLAVHIGAMYFSPTQSLLRLEPLTLTTWLRIAMISCSIIAVVELHKLIRRPHSLTNSQSSFYHRSEVKDV